MMKYYCVGQLHTWKGNKGNCMHLLGRPTIKGNSSGQYDFTRGSAGWECKGVATPT